MRRSPSLLRPIPSGIGTAWREPARIRSRHALPRIGTDRPVPTPGGQAVGSGGILTSVEAGDDWLVVLRARARLSGNGCYLGAAGRSPVFAPPEQGALVLGPPRSGKTTGVVIPNVLAADGALVVSTKRDVLDATLSRRRRFGRCTLFDPAGSLDPPPGVLSVGWSPLRTSADWPAAVAVAEAMVGAARPHAREGESAHWSERASALLAALFHGAALEGAAMDELVAWVNRREAARAMAVVGQCGSPLAADLLAGLSATDSRELSGIWSTASSVLAAYRTPAALDSARRPAAPLGGLLEGANTVYVVASAEHQRHAAPIIAGLVRDLRDTAYRSAQGSPARPAHRVLLVLDELANIAPLHDLPELVSEGGSQGLVTLACLQDLSQARQRWGVAADGFFSLFGAKIILGGLGDLRTLEAVSLVAGDRDVTVRSVTRSGRGQTSRTRATRRQRLLPPDAIATLARTQALVITAGAVRRVELPAFFPDAPGRDRRAAPRRRRPVEVRR